MNSLKRVDLPFEPQLNFTKYQQRFQSGEERSIIFRDLIVEEIGRLRCQMLKERFTLLDIGCGGGFDHKPNLQNSIAQEVDEYIGVEPDGDIELDPAISTAFRSSFEQAPIDSGSISLAFSIMVLEHVDDAEQFWQKVHDVLTPGGVFWGVTVDQRNWFVHASALLESLGLKNTYLQVLHGKRGTQRYENYSTHYKSNSPKQIAELTQTFRKSDIINFSKIGQLDYYFPKSLQWVGRTIDRLTEWCDLPGAVMAVRVEK